MSTTDIKRKHIGDIINEANILKQNLQIQDTNTVLFLINLAEARIRNDTLDNIETQLANIEFAVNRLEDQLYDAKNK